MPLAYSITNPNKLLRLAFKDAGLLALGQTLSPEDLQEGLDRLNMMLSQWAMQRYMVYRLEDVFVTSTGVLSYTIGPAEPLPAPAPDIVYGNRPDQIEAAYARQLSNTGGSPVDYPLGVLNARENYAQISLKTLGTFPQYCWYDPDLPYGKIYPWPVPQASLYEIHVLVKVALNVSLAAADDIILPDVYMAAIHYNMAVRLGIAYRMPVGDDLKGMARDSLSTIRESNTQIPTLSMPTELMRGGIYNPYSDQTY